MEPAELAGIALDAATGAGAGYADARFVEELTESITVQDERVEDLESGRTRGIGVRVLVDGCWGFASSALVDEASVAATGKLAVKIARASARLQRERVMLAEAEPVVATWATPVVTDPFELPLDAKLALLLDACAAQRTVDGLAYAQASLDLWRRRTVLHTSEGTRLDQTVTQTGAGIESVATGEGDLQRRSWPNSFRGQYESGGWEAVLAMELAANGPRVAREAVGLLTAPELPERTTTVILDGQQLALQLHESVGHALELDRIFGMEAGYAGTSFVTPADRGHLRYGAERMSVTIDSTTPGGLGTFGYDDEGVPAQRTEAIVDGVLEGFLTSRETAAVLGETSNGTMRADGWHSLPLIRMTNVNLEPGAGPLDELIADTSDGVLLATNKSWSIDDKRINFQFATEAAWEIRDGRLGRMYKNPTYDGKTTQFWGSMNALCGPEEWRIWGTPNCGKGQPGQVARVSHGVAPGRFHDVHVGVKA